MKSQIGIDPPRGVLLYGPPGTGKTMMARAVAATCNCSFIKMVGSEFVQKYLGEGPRMVNPQPDTTDPKPLNPKPYALKPKPFTLNPKSLLCPSTLIPEALIRQR